MRKIWDRESITKAALKCETRTQFMRTYSRAYHIASTEGYLSEITGHMKEVRKPRGFWTLENLRDEIVKNGYINRTAFKKGSGSAYNIANRDGLLDELFPLENS